MASVRAWRALGALIAVSFFTCLSAAPAAVPPAASNPPPADMKAEGKPAANTTTAPDDSTNAPGTPKCPTEAEFDKVRVLKAYNKADKSEHVQLRHDVVVEVDGAQILMKAATCTKPTKKILLYLDGRPIKNVTPDPPSNPKENTFIFPLRRDEDSRNSWTPILGKPSFKPRPVVVSIGLEDGYALPVADEAKATVKLDVLPTWWVLGWCAVLGLILCTLFRLRNTGAMRVQGVKTSRGPKAFSLSRVQLAWWTCMTLGGYAFIGIVTGDYSTSITSSVLTLIGISAGTTGISAVIDKGDAEKAERNGKTLEVPASEGFWTDIVSDQDGVSFHRYQMAVWTVVLGIVFWILVFRDLAMPNFSETLLGLMGISAGTYLGVKTTESKPAQK